MSLSNAFSHMQSEEGRVKSALLLRPHPHSLPSLRMGPLLSSAHGLSCRPGRERSPPRWPASSFVQKMHSKNLKIAEDAHPSFGAYVAR